MKIALMGYMGSGKSVIGTILADKLGILYTDLDCFIEEKEQLSIAEIFETKGEIYFRKIEATYLEELLNQSNDAIISLGGGTPCYGNNIRLIEKKAISFYLNATINTIYERLKGETSKRPLIATVGEENLKEYIAKHLFERTVFYEKANHTILVNNKSMLKIVDEIRQLL